MTPSETLGQWDTKIKFRGVDHKTNAQLEELVNFYSNDIPAQVKYLEKLRLQKPSPTTIGDCKINYAIYMTKRSELNQSLHYTKDKIEEDRLTRDLREIEERIYETTKTLNIPEDIAELEEKIPRLEDKLACCLKELELREANLVEREIHGTLYYIDNDFGDDLNDGLGIGTAWETIRKFTTVTARTAGDIAKVRANQTYTQAADITFDEDGNVGDYIEIRGCSVADDPWGDASNVKPIITFGGANIQIRLWKVYWKLNNLDIKDATDPNGLIDAGSFTWVLDCDIHSENAGCEGVYIDARTHLLFEGCSFYDCLSYGIYIRLSTLRIVDSTFNGGALTTDYGIWICTISYIELLNVTFGLTTTHDLADIAVTEPAALIKGRNVQFGSGTYIKDMSDAAHIDSFAQIEDYQAVKLANKSFYWNGTITKDTGVTHGGGASSSAKVEPTANCTPNSPLTLGGNQGLLKGDFTIWCLAAATTITVYIRSIDAWATYPTAAELYITAEYYDGATAKRAESTHSVQVIADAASWVAFTTTFTPNSAGWVYVKVYLKKYVANKGIYVDVKPVVS